MACDTPLDTEVQVHPLDQMTSDTFPHFLIVTFKYVLNTNMFEMYFKGKPKKLTPNSKSEKLIKQILLT